MTFHYTDGEGRPMTIEGRPMITSDSPLLNLPNELLDHIASYLPPPDLRTLRLVSQAVHIRCNDRINETCFSHLRAAFWLPPSLDAMRSLVRHKRLGSWVEDLTIFVDRPVLAEDARHCVPGCADDEALRAQYMAGIEATQRQAGPDGAHAETLRQVFVAYGAMCASHPDKWPSIWIQNINGEGRAPLSRLEERFGGLVSYAPNADCSTTITTIMQSMTAAILAPWQLSFGFSPISRGFGIPVKMFSPPSIFDPSCAVFSRLEVLALTLQGTPMQEDMPTRDRDVHHLFTFLSSVGQRLKTLYLGGQLNGFEPEQGRGTRYSNEVLLDRLCDNKTVFPELSILTLHCLPFSQDRLVDFLVRQRATLTYLALNWVALTKYFPDEEQARQAQERSTAWKQEFVDELAASGLPPMKDLHMIECHAKVVRQ